MEVLGRRIPASLIRDVILIVGFAALVTACGRIRFYIPDDDFAGLVNPTPITLQTFGVLLTGAALGSWRGTSSLLLFYFVGMAGLPVFQGGNNGWNYVTTSATGGYLIGFIAAAFVTGFLVERGWNRGNALWALLIGNAVLYVPGLLWLGTVISVPWEDVPSKGLYLFIPGDVLKLMMAGIVLPSAWALVSLRNDRRR
ncbi:MAG: biotin transporter BioY [Acidobacteria bacterium]|nr:biotin transporter BioY [Acidobacteriota bacterium]